MCKLCLKHEIYKLMERRVKGNFHARCGAGEKLEIISKAYLSLSGAKSQGMKQVKCLLRWQNSFDKAVSKTAYYVISVPIFPIKR